MDLERQLALLPHVERDLQKQEEYSRRLNLAITAQREFAALDRRDLSIMIREQRRKWCKAVHRARRMGDVSLENDQVLRVKRHRITEVCKEGEFVDECLEATAEFVLDSGKNTLITQEIIQNSAKEVYKCTEKMDEMINLSEMHIEYRRLTTGGLDLMLNKEALDSLKQVMESLALDHITEEEKKKYLEVGHRKHQNKALDQNEEEKTSKLENEEPVIKTQAEHDQESHEK